jgi:RNA polymerase sigma factor (sigma-70 family)
MNRENFIAMSQLHDSRNLLPLNFENLVTLHYEGLYRFAFSLTRSEADASDLTQQTFCIWATKGNQLKDPCKVKTWLFTTLHRLFLADRRRQLRFPHYELSDVESELPATDPLDFIQLDSAQLYHALDSLDDIYQATVSLFYLEDYSYNEIARTLDVPLGTVKSRIARGLNQLHKLLALNLTGTPLDAYESAIAG